MLTAGRARAGRANANCDLCGNKSASSSAGVPSRHSARLGRRSERRRSGLFSPRCGGLRRDESMGGSSSKAKEAAPPPPPSEGKFGVRVRPAVPSTHSQPQPPSLSFHAAADFAGADREHARGERRPGYRTGRRRRRDPEPRGAQRDAPACLPGGCAPLWRHKAGVAGQRGARGRWTEAGRSSGRRERPPESPLPDA